jgi:NTE family protein
MADPEPRANGNQSPLAPDAWPVHDTAGDSDEAEQGIALCLSGGGYRAMLFHVGALWRLNQAKLLARLDRVSSVSGGSITAGALGIGWRNLAFDGEIATNFIEVVVDPLRALARTTIDRPAIIGGLLLPGDAASRITDALDDLLGGATLQDLPAGKPRFVINATNLESGVLWRFSRPYMRDYRVGEVVSPRRKLAEAVAASAAFPPFLSPLTLDLRNETFTPDSGTDLQYAPFTDRAELSDGGVYDNLGLETAFKRYKTLLVSDGGGAFEPDPDPPNDWVLQMVRVLRVIDNQVRSLRKRQLIAAYESKIRQGAYWGIWSNIAQFDPAPPGLLPAPHEATRQLAAVATRLADLPDETHERLINWGYAVCDAAIRTHLITDGIEPPAGFPYPGSGVGA